jgi:hypothetical protein
MVQVPALLSTLCPHWRCTPAPPRARVSLVAGSTDFAITKTLAVGTRGSPQARDGWRAPPPQFHDPHLVRSCAPHHTPRRAAFGRF